MKYQYLNTLKQILRNDSVPVIVGFWNFLNWQVIRYTRKFPIELNLSRSKLIVNRRSGTAALVRIFGLYDYNNMMLIKKALTEFSKLTFIDTGANIGTYTLIASETGAKVFAFEPHPETFLNLVNNLEVNQRINVSALNLALSDSGGFVNFSNFSENSINRIDANGSLSVPCGTLDDIVKKNNIAKCIVKIDVEGNEIPVLKGFERNIENAKLFFIENGENLAIKEHMNCHGFMGPFYYTFKSRPYRSHRYLNGHQKTRPDRLRVSSSGEWIRTTDLQVMSLTSCLCSTPHQPLYYTGRMGDSSREIMTLLIQPQLVFRLYLF
jgi:FkbM family methyltransferase